MKYKGNWPKLGVLFFVFVCLLGVGILSGFWEGITHDNVVEENISQRDLSIPENGQENPSENNMQSAPSDAVNNSKSQSSEDDWNEIVEPLVDEELYLYIKGVYDEIDWDVQFLPGDESKQDLYREQFIKLLKEEIPVVDDRGYETTLSHIGYIEIDYDYPDYDPNHYNYHFYDVDGDGTPEIGVTDNHSFVYIFKYEEDADRVVLWDEYLGGMVLLGTGKFIWRGGWGGNGLMGLDQNGDYIFLARYKMKGGSKYIRDDDEGWAYFVTLPNVELEDWMLAQATYEDGDYFFRVTGAQFDELKNPYLEAVHEGFKEKEEVTYTYEELLNLK